MNESKPDQTKKRRRVKGAIRLIGVTRATLGTVLLAAPRLSSRLLLASTQSNKLALTLGRMTAGRDLVLGLGTLLSNWSRSTSQSEWIIAGLVADTMDLYAFVRDDSLRPFPRVLSGIFAAGAIGLGAWALKNLDALEESSTQSDPRSEVG